MNSLVKIDAALRALAEATSVDEAKDVRDKAEALRKYFRKREGGINAANQAMELVLRAERKMGELLAINPDFGWCLKSIACHLWDPNWETWAAFRHQAGQAR